MFSLCVLCEFSAYFAVKIYRRERKDRAKFAKGIFGGSLYVPSQREGDTKTTDLCRGRHIGKPTGDVANLDDGNVVHHRLHCPLMTAR
jgi:hypothetical protein